MLLAGYQGNGRSRIALGQRDSGIAPHGGRGGNAWNDFIRDIFPHQCVQLLGRMGEDGGIPAFETHNDPPLGRSGDESCVDFLLRNDPVAAMASQANPFGIGPRSENQRVDEVVVKHNVGPRKIGQPRNVIAQGRPVRPPPNTLCRSAAPCGYLIDCDKAGRDRQQASEPSELTCLQGIPNARTTGFSRFHRGLPSLKPANCPRCPVRERRGRGRLDLDTSGELPSYSAPGQGLRRHGAPWPAGSRPISGTHTVGSSMSSQPRSHGMPKLFDLPLLVGIGLTFLFYWIVGQEAMKDGLLYRYTTEHIVEYVIVAFFLWGLSDVAIRSLGFPRQMLALKQVFLPSRTNRESVATVGALARICKRSRNGSKIRGLACGWRPRWPISRKKDRPTDSPTTCAIWPNRMKTERTQTMELCGLSAGSRPCWDSSAR